MVIKCWRCEKEKDVSYCSFCDGEECWQCSDLYHRQEKECDVEGCHNEKVRGNTSFCFDCLVEATDSEAANYPYDYYKETQI